MPLQFDPPSGTRDFLAAELETRQRAFAVIDRVYTSYGFEPLQTPAFERLDVLMGKYGDEGDKLIFKILRRGEHEASGEADLALRYDLTVPLARVAAAYGSRLPSPYKRYALGTVWRADRPGKGRYREFTQCDLDTLGSKSLLADAEVLCAQNEALTELGVPGFRIRLNSRLVLTGLLETFDVPAELGSGVLASLDKLDKLSANEVQAELVFRGLSDWASTELVGALAAHDSGERVRAVLKSSQTGEAGLEQIDEMLSLVSGQIPDGRVEFTPDMVRGLSYYTGPIWEVVTRSVTGSIAGGGRYDRLIADLGGPDVPATGAALGIERILASLPSSSSKRRQLDVAVTVMEKALAGSSFAFAGQARAAGLRAAVYLGSSGKFGRQLKWASESGARWCLIYGANEDAEGVVTVRDLESGEQLPVPVSALTQHLARLVENQENRF